MNEALNTFEKPAVCKMLKISPRGLSNMVSEGRFPRGVRTGKKDSWSALAIERWRQAAYAEQESWRPIMK